MSNVCAGCGQLSGVEEYDRKLWELQERRRDGRQHNEALTFTSEEVDLWESDLDDGIEILDLVMSKDMAQRGLCPICGRPDLTGMTDEDFVTEDEARELAEMAAEQAAERRAGC